MNRILLSGILFGLLIISCSEEEDPVDCEKAGPVISLGAVEDAASCSSADGSIKVSASSGKEPYQFSVNDFPFQESGQFSDLNAGIYTVLVKDANGCTATVDNVLVKALDFTFAAAISSDKSCLSGDGQIVVEVADGNPPYSFKLGNGSFSDDNSFSGLASGNHTIVVRDNAGCDITLSLTVPRGFSGVSWESQIKPIIEASCSQSGCHNGTSRPDLRKFENAKFYANSIKSKTKDKSMPREGSLSQQQIALIACWVDDGAINN